MKESYGPDAAFAKSASAVIGQCDRALVGTTRKTAWAHPKNANMLQHEAFLGPACVPAKTAAHGTVAARWSNWQRPMKRDEKEAYKVLLKPNSNGKCANYPFGICTDSYQNSSIKLSR